MGGIDLRNLREGSILRNAHRWGTTILVPPGDEQQIVASTGLADNTADANFALAAPINNQGGHLHWPCRLWVVLRNVNNAGVGPPGITTVNAAFGGGDSFEVVITGTLGGTRIVETMYIDGDNAAGLLISPGGQQRGHQISRNYFDQITTIRHQNKRTDASWGRTTPLQVSVGLGNCEFGDGSFNRLEVYAPFQPQSALNNTFKRLLYMDGTSVGVQTAGNNNTTAVVVQGETLLRIPGKALEYRTSTGRWTVDVTANTLTKTAHGLVDGNTVRLADAGDGLPGNTAIDTTYYVVTATANTIQIAATPSGAAIDLTAAGDFADTEEVIVMRPYREWRFARMIYHGDVAAEGRS